MIRILKKLPSESDAGDFQGHLPLPFTTRSRSRFRGKLTDGREVGAFLPRGTLLRGGDVVETSTGERLLIVAAAETVSTASSPEVQALLSAAYHLGNRHVELQLLPGAVRYRHDHVLDAMVRELGLTVIVEEAPFEPEAGAYHGHSHTHSHGTEHEHAGSRGHNHSHGHGHSHGHSHAHHHASEHGHGHAHSHAADDQDRSGHNANG